MLTIPIILMRDRTSQHSLTGRTLNKSQTKSRSLSTNSTCGRWTARKSEVTFRFKLDNHKKRVHSSPSCFSSYVDNLFLPISLAYNLDLLTRISRPAPRGRRTVQIRIPEWWPCPLPAASLFESVGKGGSATAAWCTLSTSSFSPRVWTMGGFS